MTIFDHLFVGVWIVLIPLYSVRNVRALERAGDTGPPDLLVREYKESAALLWLMGAAALLVWVLQGRPIASLGLAAPIGFVSIPPAIFSLAVVLFLMKQLSRVRAMTHRPTVGIEDAESLGAVLPKSDLEFRYFVVVALSAGVVEEIVYRGYLIRYLETYTPLWLAVILAAVLFAYAHLYQGLAQLPKILISALAFGGLFVWTGSLLLPILLHSFGDIIMVVTAREALGKPPLEPES